MNYVKILKEMREKQGISQEEISKESNLTLDCIKELETKHSDYVEIWMLRRYASVLGRTLEIYLQ
jgi:ribosome-binding protein aMBF1 (putative translation factor)